MRRDVSNRLIGLFVVVGIAIMFTFVMLFGVGKYFHEERNFVLYFDGSLHGLNVGAPVEFRGVKVGEVEEIRVEMSQKTEELTLPVVISIQPYHLVETEVMAKKIHGKVLNNLIEKGLSAQLKAESLLTGSLFVELDVRKDVDIKLHGSTSSLREIPTVESRSEQLSDIIKSARGTLESIENFVTSEKLNQSIEDLSAMMESGKVAMGEAENTMKDARQAISKIDKYMEPIASKLMDTLQEFPDMISAIRVLVDYLSRHPEALLKGKS